MVLILYQTIVREDRLHSNVFLTFRHMSHSKLSAKRASEDCMLFFFKSQFLSIDKVLGLLDLDWYQYSL